MLETAFLSLVLGFQTPLVPAAYEVKVTVPATVLRAACVVRRAGVAVVHQEGRSLVFQCPSHDESVSCDFEGAEPIDVTLADVCRSRALPVRPAQRVALAPTTPAQLTAEWLVFALESRGVEVLATRQLSTDRGLFVAVRDDRFLRFLRSGAAPVTVRARELIHSQPWLLPDPAPGGEMIARIEPAEISPARFRLTGPRNMEMTASEDLIVARGLPPGRYQLTPEYSGGPSGRVRPFAIADTRSSAMYIRREEVGAVQLLAGPALCGEATQLQVVKVTTSSVSDGVSTSRVVVTRVAPDPTCSTTIAGLAAGKYEASYLGAGGQLAATEFAVSVGLTSTITVTPTTVRVFGRVLLNGKAGIGVRISFHPDDSPPGVREIRATTDSEGAYEVRLSKPGVFRVNFEKNGLPIVTDERMTRVAEGDNSVDWPIDSYSVKVHITGWDRAARLIVAARRMLMTAPGPTGTGRVINLGDELPVVIDGLSVGTYRIEVRQDARKPEVARAMGSAIVALDENHPDAIVRIDLKMSDRLLLVVDVSGVPVEKARVEASAGNGDPLPAASPGTFSLADVMPGAFLNVAGPGLVGVCRIVPDEPQFRVELDAGIPVRLVFSGRSDVKEPVGLLVWSGSECPVPLARLEYVSVPAETAGAIEFLVKAFPRAADLRYIVGPFDKPDAWLPIRIEPNGTVPIRLPERK